jgi:mannose-6-phosphate isomerase
MVHAIGAGCLILEIQEPTDFTIQPEYFCGDFRLNEREMYIGLAPDTALTVFDYSIYGERAVEMGRKTPKIVKNEDGVKHEALITYSDTPCFAVERYTVTASKTTLTDKPAVYVIVDGEGEIICGENTAKVKKGDYFLLPHSAEETVLVTDNTVTVVACLPPKK